MHFHNVFDQSYLIGSQIFQTIKNIDQATCVYFGKKIIYYGKQKPITSLISTIAIAYLTTVGVTLATGFSLYLVGKIITHIPFINKIHFINSCGKYIETTGVETIVFAITLITVIFHIFCEKIYTPITTCLHNHIFIPIWNMLIKIVSLKIFSFFGQQSTNSTTPNTDLINVTENLATILEGARKDSLRIYEKMLQILPFINFGLFCCVIIFKVANILLKKIELKHLLKDIETFAYTEVGMFCWIVIFKIVMNDLANLLFELHDPMTPCPP